MNNSVKKRAISKLSKGFLRTNKLRNIFAIIGIILTTVMFTTLFTVGMSMKKSMEESMMRQVGGKGHITLKHISEEQYNNIKTNSIIKECGLSIPLSIAENEELIKYPNEIKYATEKQAEFNFSKPMKGNMPEKYDEVAMDTDLLNALDLSDKLGEKVELEYTLNNKKIRDTFTLCGTWTRDKVIPASEIWISKDYLDSKLKDYTPVNSKDSVGKINADIVFKNDFNINGKVVELITSSGYDINDIEYGVNWAYIGSSGDIDLTVVLVVLGVIALIVLCGYLIIYNIFFISISKDIKFYGLLKTVGATTKQIKSMIKREAIILCILAEPIGLLIGYVIGRIITPIALREIDLAKESISVSPFIFIGAFLFSILTVFISILKPANMAGKITPMEALNNNIVVNENKISNKQLGRGLFKMAYSNIFKYNNKALFITISLSLSLIILNLTYVIVNSFDMNTYLSKRMCTDFIVADSSYFSTQSEYDVKHTLSNNVLEELSSLNGVKECGHIKFLEGNDLIDSNINDRINNNVYNNPQHFSEEMVENIKNEVNAKQLMVHIYGLNEALIDKLSVKSGNVEYSKLKIGNYIIASTNDSGEETSIYNLGDKIELKNDNSKQEYEVIAIADIPNMISVRHQHSLNLSFYMSEDTFNKYYGNKEMMLITLNVNEGEEGEVESFIKKYTKQSKNLSYESKSVFEKEFNSTKETYLIIGVLLSFILGLIGIMNFANTIISSILLRKRELAMLQSIGMTKTQMKKMLVWEGEIYCFMTAAFVLSIGTLIDYILGKGIVSAIWFLKFKFTIMPVIICLPILFIIALIIPRICYTFISKSSIIERLREI